MSLSLSEKPGIKITDMTPGVMHEKLVSIKKILACPPFPCCITRIRRCLSVTFAESKVLLFWSCLYFPEVHRLIISIQTAHLFLWH